ESSTPRGSRSAPAADDPRSDPDRTSTVTGAAAGTFRRPPPARSLRQALAEVDPGGQVGRPPLQELQPRLAPRPRFAVHDADRPEDRARAVRQRGARVAADHEPVDDGVPGEARIVEDVVQDQRLAPDDDV